MSAGFRSLSCYLIRPICQRLDGRKVHSSCQRRQEKVSKTWNSWNSLGGKGNIILMGNPGSGKTTTGRILAQELNRRLVDIDDHHLEPSWGMSVADKLKQIGAKRFVEEEGRALLDLNVEDSVISLSGSNPLHGDSMARLAQSGVLVYLDANNDTIIQRQRVMKVDRIIGMESGASLEDVLRYRRQFYEKWYDIRVCVHESDTADDVARKVSGAVQSFLSDPGYVSTRGSDTNKSSRFSETVLQGLAQDGGLFVKAGSRPRLTLEDIQTLVNLDYRDRAHRILEAWVHPLDISPQTMNTFVNKSYTEGLFEHTDVAPVIHLEDNLFTQELFHGPTASFKDFALQLMPRFFSHAMNQSEEDHQYLILAATSGDTGSATLDGFSRHASGANIGVLVLYPDRNISNIQRCQTVTMQGSNIKVIGVEGDFDFCQQTVKKVFTDQNIKDSLGRCKLSAANSINWGRVLPQVLYHATAYLNLVRDGIISLGDHIDLCVPTGNFGNILSAYYVKEMGFPIRKLICASNSNRILTDLIQSGIYSPSAYTLKRTMSPSIDIIMSSNLERLLFHLSGDNSQFVTDFYQAVLHQGSAQLPHQVREKLTEHFQAASASEEETKKAILRVFEKTGYLMDPHTAVGYHVAKHHGDPQVPTVVAGTAHYAKFLDNILQLLKPNENFSSFSAVELMSAASCLSNRPGMNKLLNAMVTKQVVHKDTVPGDYGQISKHILDFAKIL